MSDPDALARLAHAHFCAHPGVKHAREACRWLQRCGLCEPLLTSWEALTEAQRDVFRAQAAPFVEVWERLESRERWMRFYRDGILGVACESAHNYDHDAWREGRDAERGRAVRNLAEQTTGYALDALLAQARAEVARGIVEATPPSRIRDLAENAADRIAPGWRDIEKEKG